MIKKTTISCGSLRGAIVVIALPLWAATVAGSSWAAGRVRLELVGDARGSALVFQEWIQVLGKAGVRDVRIRMGDETTPVGIETAGTPQNPLYVVTGVVKSRDELLLPSGVFRRGDVARLAKWLDNVAVNGPPDRRPAKVAFGLTQEQFEQFRSDLARPVGFSTRAVRRGEVAEKIAAALPSSLQLDARTLRAVGDDPVIEQFQGVSSGTALACMLRPAGYCLVPRVALSQVTCQIVKAEAAQESWPVGWSLAAGKSPRDVMAALFEFLNVTIQDVSAAQAVEAISQRVKVAVVYDHQALARQGIDPAKVKVSLPPGRTTYSVALRRLLFQARLQFEIRLDDAGKPLLWISTIKPA